MRVSARLGVLRIDPAWRYGFTMQTTPPGPPGDAIAHSERYARDPIGFLEQCHRDYGDIFALKLIERDMVFVCSPDLVKAVYTGDTSVLRAGEAKVALFGKILGNSSSLLLDDREHIRRRQLIQPRFRGDAAKAFSPLIRAAARAMVGRMPHKEVFELHPLLYAMGFDIIFDALFRDTPASLRNPMHPVLREFATAAAGSPLLMRPSQQVDDGPESPWGKVAASVRAARTTVDAEIVRRRRENEKREDILGLLIDARDDDGNTLDDSEIIDEVLTTIVAGHETSSIALSWMCHAVFSRPVVLEKLRQELASGGDIDELPYLEGVVRETLRYHSLIPAGSARLVARDFEIGGYRVAKNSILSVAFHPLHRRPEIFSEPNEFRPERYIEKKYSPYEWAPFGGGPRRCLGMPFANIEMKIVLTTIIQEATLRLESADVRTQWRGMFLMPKDGLRVSID